LRLYFRDEGWTFLKKVINGEKKYKVTKKVDEFTMIQTNCMEWVKTLDGQKEDAGLLLY